jgi:UDP-N-acetylglucosamine 2-epimerase
MLDQVLNLFKIRPDFDLHLMESDQSLSSLTARLFSGLDNVLEKVRPDWVLSQGDTTTAMVAALVSFYKRVKFGHVEAGLRTGDKHRPFPEEINRRIADLLADQYFAPTERSRKALLDEGVDDTFIHVVGNTVIDALQEVASRPYNFSQKPLDKIPRDKQLVLITTHRRESFGEDLRQCCLAIRDLVLTFQKDGIYFVYPVHLNPNVRAPVFEILSGYDNITLLPPLDYAAMVHLMKRSSLILTDSGGIQEEAPSLKVPVLVMREKTERPEGVEAGVSRLVGTNRECIVADAERLLRDPAAKAEMIGENPYGDGKSAQRIVNILNRQGQSDNRLTFKHQRYKG